MESMKNDAIGGFNAFLEEQKALPGKMHLTVILFDHDFAVAFDGDLKDAKPLDHKTFIPRGNTALLDAIGRGINLTEVDVRKSKVDKVAVVILTDGEENASKEFNQDVIRKMIEHQQRCESWEFFFLAANQDAFTVGSSIGVKGVNSITYEASGAGVRGAYSNITNSVKNIRS